MTTSSASLASVQNDLMNIGVSNQQVSNAETAIAKKPAINMKKLKKATKFKL